MNEINNTFLKFSKRSETLDIDYLVKTFVNVGPLFTILSNNYYIRKKTGDILEGIKQRYKSN